MKDWLTMTAADLGRGIAEGQIDPVALCKTYLEAIDAHPLKDRIYARVTADRAMSEAAAASDRAKAGHRLSPLDGVPISWKDLFDTAGIETEAGTRLLQGRVPAKDAEVLKNATAMGLVCLGKTHMSELAFSGLGHNPSTATPPCVNDEEAVSGGSSSGAAASVAFGLAAAAIGSDTGGSVRVPRPGTILSGLKPPRGDCRLKGSCRWPRNSTPWARCAGRSRMQHCCWQRLRGQSPPIWAALTLKGAGLQSCGRSRWTICRKSQPLPFVRLWIYLKDAGATVEDITVPDLEDAMPLSGCLFTAEAYGVWRDVIEANPDAMYAEVLERFRLGQGPLWPRLCRCVEKA